jgi:hypothetical protein
LDAPRDTLILHGLQTEIVDAAESVLIDEARTRLITSAERPNTALAEIAGPLMQGWRDPCWPAKILRWTSQGASSSPSPRRP